MKIEYIEARRGVIDYSDKESKNSISIKVVSIDDDKAFTETELIKIVTEKLKYLTK